MNQGSIVDKTINHSCSRCGNCCGLFIPFTEKELSEIKEYVKENNIEPVDRVNKMTGAFNATCCFYDMNKKECRVYEVRPYACRDFKCDRKDWLKRRDSYENRAKYNSSLSKKKILASFDDKIYGDYVPIIRYIFSMLPKIDGQIESEHLVALLKSVNRLDILKFVSGTTTEGDIVDGKDFMKGDK